MALFGNEEARRTSALPKEEKVVSARTGELHTLLGKGSEFDGKLSFEGQVRIDGKYTGQITTKDVLVIGESAKVNAEIIRGHRHHQRHGGRHHSRHPDCRAPPAGAGEGHHRDALDVDGEGRHLRGHHQDGRDVKERPAAPCTRAEIDVVQSRWWWAGPALALWACPADTSSDARGGLRVPLPDGWRASSSTGVLQVGPTGRVVLQLESLNMPLPAIEQLAGPLERERVAIILKESTDSFVGVKYRFIDSTNEGFLGVQRTKGRIVWCATTKGAKADEVEAAMKVCRGVSEGRLGRD